MNFSRPMSVHRGLVVDTMRFGLLLVAVILIIGCSKTMGPEEVSGDLIFEEYLVAGQESYRIGDIEQSVDRFEDALNRARAMDDREGVRVAAYNLSLSLAALDRDTESWGFLEEVAAESVDVPVMMSMVILTQAHLLHKAGRFQEAAAAVKRSERIFPSEQSLSQSMMRSILSARIHCDSNEVEQGLRILADVDSHLSTEELAELEAEYEEVLGNCLLHSGDVRAAAQAFDRQLEQLKELGHYRAVAETLEASGRAYRRAGEYRKSSDRFYRAFRSYVGRGDAGRACVMVEGILQEDGYLELEQYPPTERLSGLIDIWCSMEPEEQRAVK